MPSISVTEQGGGEISIYNDAIATEAQVNKSVAMIIASYPNLFSRIESTSLQQFSVMMKEAIKYSRMSGQQLYDATMHCICNKRQEYQFQISDITSYDTNVKLYTYGWAVGRQGYVRSNLKRTDCTPWEYWWCRAQDLEKVNRLAERQTQTK